MFRKLKITTTILIGLLTVGLFLTEQNSDNKNQSKIDLHNNSLVSTEAKNTVSFLKNSKDTPTNDLKIFPIAQLPHHSKFNNIFAVNKKEPIKTNQWFSSIYFIQGSENIFILPWIVKFSNNGLTLSSPDVVNNDNLIISPARNDIEINFQQETEAKVLSSGDFSVLVAIYSKKTDTLLAKVMLTRGSPYIFLDINDSLNIKINTSQSVETLGDTSFKIGVSDKTNYGIFTTTDLKSKKQGSKNIFIKPSPKKAANEKRILTIGVAPKNFDWLKFEKYALNPIINTKFYFLKNSNENYINVFEIQTLDKEKKTLWGLLPHQRVNLLTNNNEPHCFANQFYTTIRGKQEICLGKTFYIENKKSIVPPISLDIKKVELKYRKNLEEIVKQETNDIQDFKATDSYFLGKELLRIAQLYNLSKQLNLKKESEKLKNILYSEFNVWRENITNNKTPLYGKYIVYDNKIKGVITQRPSFGSDEFNDHHFHYGYFVHIAAILAKYDSKFLKENKPIVNLLVKDYLNFNRNDKNFAFLRNFDIYEGHSWASGTAMFGDGNNQESSSEAIHAYYAGYLWANAIQNDDLKEISLWLYNQEIESSLTYWLLANDYSPQYPDYKHNLLSLLWGGKAEFSTWFSSEPEAKLGIELLPVTAGSEYLAQINPNIISRHLAETSFPEHKLFFDQLLMYQAVSNPRRALRLFSEVTTKDIDGSNSRSFLYAWIISRIK